MKSSLRETYYYYESCQTWELTRDGIWHDPGLVGTQRRASLKGVEMDTLGQGSKDQPGGSGSTPSLPGLRRWCPVPSRPKPLKLIMPMADGQM